MAKKLLIIIANANPQSAVEVGAPLSQALIAAAMQFETEVIFTGRCSVLAKTGVAHRLILSSESPKSAHSLIREACAEGVNFKVCPCSFEPWQGELIAEIGEMVGSTYIVSEVMDQDTVAMNY